MATAIPTLTTFTASTSAKASEVNSNFSAITTNVNSYVAWLEANQTFSGNNTFSGTITANGAVTTAAGITVNTTGVTIAPQTAITFSHASARIIPGATSLTFRNNANGADNLSIADSGAVTFRAGLSGITTLAMGGALSGVTTLAMSSTLTMSASASKIVPGATSFSHRNNADSADNILITDAGVVTVRSHLNVSGAIGGNGSTALTINPTTLSISATAGLARIGNVGSSTGDLVGIAAIGTMAGAPTGAVADGAIVVNTSNNKLYYRSSSTWLALTGV